MGTRKGVRGSNGEAVAVSIRRDKDPSQVTDLGDNEGAATGQSDGSFPSHKYKERQMQNKRRVSLKNGDAVLRYNEEGWQAPAAGALRNQKSTVSSRPAQPNLKIKHNERKYKMKNKMTPKFLLRA